MYGLIVDAAWLVAIVAVANLVFLAWNASAMRKHELTLRRKSKRDEVYADFAVTMHHLAAVAQGAGDLNDPIMSREVSEAVGSLKLFASEAVYREADAWAETILETGVAAMQAQEKRVLTAMRKDLG